jgi:hypothetical protein
MSMPGISFLVGAIVGPDEVAPYFETRGEIMSVSAGGLLQPNFVAYVSTGLRYEAVGAGIFRPYAGLGIGWNWLPEGSGGGGWGNWGSGWGNGGPYLLVAAVAAAAIALFVFAGRIEVRYTVSPDPSRAPGFVSVMLGFGA